MDDHEMIDDDDFVFDGSGVEERKAYDPLPPGWYRCRIESVSTRTTKDHGKGPGKQLTPTLVVVDGEYEKRKLFARHNIRNASAVAVQIGMGEIKNLTRSCGLPDQCDLRDLVGLEVMARVSVKPASGGYEASNEIKGYRPVDEGAEPAASTSTKEQPKKPAWKK